MGQCTVGHSIEKLTRPRVKLDIKAPRMRERSTYNREFDKALRRQTMNLAKRLTSSANFIHYLCLSSLRELRSRSLCGAILRPLTITNPAIKSSTLMVRELFSSCVSVRSYAVSAGWLSFSTYVSWSNRPTATALGRRVERGAATRFASFLTRA